MSSSKLEDKKIESFLDSDIESDDNDDPDSDIFKKMTDPLSKSSKSYSVTKKQDVKPKPGKVYRDSRTHRNEKSNDSMNKKVSIMSTKSKNLNMYDRKHSKPHEDNTKDSDCLNIKEDELVNRSNEDSAGACKGLSFAASRREAVFKIFDRFERMRNSSISFKCSTSSSLSEISQKTDNNDDDNDESDESSSSSSDDGLIREQIRKSIISKIFRDYDNRMDNSETSLKTSPTSDISMENGSKKCKHNGIKKVTKKNKPKKIRLELCKYQDLSDNEVTEQIEDGYTSELSQYSTKSVSKSLESEDESISKENADDTSSSEKSCNPYFEENVSYCETNKTKGKVLTVKSWKRRSLSESSNPDLNVTNNRILRDGSDPAPGENHCNTVTSSLESEIKKIKCKVISTIENWKKRNLSESSNSDASNNIKFQDTSGRTSTKNDCNSEEYFAKNRSSQINREILKQRNVPSSKRKSQRKRRGPNDSIDVDPPKHTRSASTSNVQESHASDSNKATPKLSKTETLSCLMNESDGGSESDSSEKSKDVKEPELNLKRSLAAKNLFSDITIKVPRIQLERYQTPFGEQWKPKNNSLNSPDRYQSGADADKTKSGTSTPEQLRRTPRKCKESDSKLDLLQSFNESSPSKQSQKSSNVSSPEKLLRTRSTSKLSSVITPTNLPVKRSLRTPKKTSEESPIKGVGNKAKASPASVTKSRRYSTLPSVTEETDESSTNKNKTPSKRVLEFIGDDENNENEIGIANSGMLTPRSGKGTTASEDKLQTPKSLLKSSQINNVHSPLSKRNITVKTPVSKKGSGRDFLSPSMAKKEHETGPSTEDALDLTRKQLHISTVPQSLPCRDFEFAQIKSFLTRKIEHCAGGCMYISGVPGTGKTATVHAVIRSLQDLVCEKELADFDFVEVNGLRLTEPKQAYVRIYQALTDQKVTADQAQQLLNKRFSTTCRKSTIILVDELDYLCNRRQDVVYNILDWPTKSNSKLVVLTISNTMDLPERTLKGRVTSRMGLTRVTFQPYTHHQLMAIVQDRLSGSDTFHPDAVQLVARKVAAVSGDARRALDICRRTTELVKSGEQVTVGHVEQALTKIFSGPRVIVIQSLNRLSQLTLRALRDVCQRTGVDEATAIQVYKHLQEICSLDGCMLPTIGVMLQTIVSLVALGLVVAEKGRMDITRKMSLNISSDDIHYALNQFSR